MELSARKVQFIFIFVAFFEALCIGMLPIKCKALSSNITALGVANAFAGGVFISIATMHIMPEQVENYEKWYKKNYGKQKEAQAEEPKLTQRAVTISHMLHRKEFVAPDKL